MFTRCKACHTVYPVNAAVLVRRNGKFRCGKCNKEGNALEALFDDWPEAGARPPIPGKLPVLGQEIDLDEAARAKLEPDEAALTGEAPPATPARRRWLRPAWMLLAVITVAGIVYAWTEHSGRSLPVTESLHQLAIRLGIVDPPPASPFRDLSQIHLVSRELKTHPTRAHRLQLTATIVNRAERAQPYPHLEVILLNAAGESISQQRFPPRAYLAAGARRRDGMTPGAFLPLVLNLDDPGVRAVGFELNFR